MHRTVRLIGQSVASYMAVGFCDCNFVRAWRFEINPLSCGFLI